MVHRAHSQHYYFLIKDGQYSILIKCAYYFWKFIFNNYKILIININKQRNITIDQLKFFPDNILSKNENYQFPQNQFKLNKYILIFYQVYIFILYSRDKNQAIEQKFIQQNLSGEEFNQRILISVIIQIQMKQFTKKFTTFWKKEYTGDKQFSNKALESFSKDFYEMFVKQDRQYNLVQEKDAKLYQNKFPSKLGLTKVSNPLKMLKGMLKFYFNKSFDFIHLEDGNKADYWLNLKITLNEKQESNTESQKSEQDDLAEILKQLHNLNYSKNVKIFDIAQFQSIIKFKGTFQLTEMNQMEFGNKLQQNNGVLIQLTENQDEKFHFNVYRRPVDMKRIKQQNSYCLFQGIDFNENKGMKLIYIIRLGKAKTKKVNLSVVNEDKIKDALKYLQTDHILQQLKFFGDIMVVVMTQEGYTSKGTWGSLIVEEEGPIIPKILSLMLNATLDAHLNRVHFQSQMSIKFLKQQVLSICEPHCPSEAHFELYFMELINMLRKLKCPYIKYN